MKPTVNHSVVALVLSILLLTSCQPLGPQTLKSTDDTVLPQLTLCQPKVCWQGISLDTVRPDNVNSYTRQIRGFEGAELTKTWTRNGFTEYGWRDRAGRFIYIAFRDDQGFRISQSVDDGQLGQIVARFGNPTHVFVWNHYAVGRLTAGVVVVYAAQGLVFFTGEERVYNDLIAISSHTKILGYDLTISSNLRTMIMAQDLADEHPRADMRYLDDYLAKAQPWHGYGDYRVDSP